MSSVSLPLSFRASPRYCFSCESKYIIGNVSGANQSLPNQLFLETDRGWTRGAELNACCSLQPCRTPKATELQGARTIMIQLLPRQWIVWSLHPLALPTNTKPLRVVAPSSIPSWFVRMHMQRQITVQRIGTHPCKVYSATCPQNYVHDFFLKIFKCGDLRGLSVSLSTELHYFFLKFSHVVIFVVCLYHCHCLYWVGCNEQRTCVWWVSEWVVAIKAQLAPRYQRHQLY